MEANVAQRLMKFGDFRCSLPVDYEPVRPKHLDIARIYLTRGSLATPERRRLVEEICNSYPAAGTIECLDMPHNRIDLGIGVALITKISNFCLNIFEK